MWNEFIDMSYAARILMEGFCGKPETHTKGPHTDIRYTSDEVDLANISIIDMRKEKKMWMMHVACFAKDTHAHPIYGFDVICGQNKITGCFHDMSPTLPSPLDKDFAQSAKRYTPERTRPLPPWAQEIFSPSMVVQGPTSNQKDAQMLSTMGKENLFHWFNTLTPQTPNPDYHTKLAKYCDNQLQNTNSKNVMISMGLDPDYVTEFKKRQFPYGK